MAMFNYESDELAQICQGNHSSDTLYVADCKKTIIDGVKGSYPQLTDYEKEWLMYGRDHYEGGEPSNLEYQTVEVNPTAMIENAIPYHYKSAILKGDTKYRDIDTGDILDTFDETKNLELVSVKAPVLKTVGKNLFDMSEIVISDFENNKYQNGYYGKEIQLQPNTTYTIKPYLTSEITNTNVWTVFNIIVNDVKTEVVNDNYTGSGVNKNSWNTQTFRTDETGVIGYSIYCHKDKEESWFGNLPIEVQLEVGSIATSYEPYKSNILTVNEEVELRGIGDVKDTLDLITGELTQRVRQFALKKTLNNANVNITKSVAGTTTNTNSYLICDSTLLAETKGGICDTLPTVKLEDDATGIVFGRGGAGVLFIKTTKDIATVGEFKEWLKTSDAVVVVPKAESVKTVALSHQIKPYEGTNHYEVSSDTISPIAELSVPVVSTGAQTLNEILTAE